MPKKIKSGEGMMERTRVEFDFTGENAAKEIEAFQDYAKLSFIGVDEKRELVAEGFRAFLSKVGVADPQCPMELMFASHRYSEETLEHLSAKWLIEYHHLQSGREKLSNTESPSTLEHLVERAVTLGQIQERIWWRQGVEERTGKRPETLALSGRRQVKNGRQGKEMQAPDDFRNKDLANVQARAEKLHDLKPNWNYKRIQIELTKEFGYSSSTFKRHLTNPLKKKGS